MKNFKVLMIAPTSFFADYGCHVRILEEALILQKMGHEITICTYHNGQDVKGLEIERTLSIPWRREYEVGSSRHKVAFDLLLFLKSLFVALRKKPEIIHAHLHEGALIGYPISLLLRIPLVFDFQGSLTSEMIDHHFLKPDGPFYSPMRRLEEIITRLPEAIITSSQHAKKLLCNEFGCHEERIHVVPDGVNPELFQRNGDQEAEALLKFRLGIPPDRKIVVYLGLLAEYQGIGLLLEGIAALGDRLRNAHFLIMGFPGVDYYRMRAQQLGIEDRVTFTGKVPYWEAPSYLALGDVAVAPKISATEGSGKLLNYMAMALPIVAFDTSVSREYLGEWGVYAPKGDAVALAEAILSLLDNEGRAKELGRRLRERVARHYHWQEAGKEIVRIYENRVGT
jgi:glycosyltransferase involved in cell wall biosynthesis